MKSWVRWDRGQQEVQRQSEQREQRQTELQRRIDDHVALALARDPQFLEKAYMPVGLVPLISESDSFTDLAYYFGDHPEQVQRILSLSETAAAREIGKLEAKLATKPSQKITTKAPSPTAPGGGKETVGKREEDMTTAEWIAYKNREEFGSG